MAYEADLEAQKSRCLEQIRTLKSRERLLAGIDRQLMEMAKENISNHDTDRTINSRKPENRVKVPEREAPARSEEKVENEKEEVIR